MYSLLLNASLALQSAEAAAPSSGGSLIGSLLALLFSLCLVVAGWKTYAKTGRPGWASIVPVYNAYTLLQIVGRPAWWLVLLLIPGVNVVVAVILSIDLAKCFGKSTSYGLGLAFLSAPFTLHLGFGEAQYGGPCAS